MYVLLQRTRLQKTVPQKRMKNLCWRSHVLKHWWRTARCDCRFLHSSKKLTNTFSWYQYHCCQGNPLKVGGFNRVFWSYCTDIDFVELLIPIEDPPVYSLVSNQHARPHSGRIVHSVHPYHPIVWWHRYKGMFCCCWCWKLVNEET